MICIFMRYQVNLVFHAKIIDMTRKGDAMKIDMQQLAEYLAINQEIISRWVQNKEIPYGKNGRFVMFELDKIETWIENSREKIYKRDLFLS